MGNHGQDGLPPCCCGYIWKSEMEILGMNDYDDNNNENKNRYETRMTKTIMKISEDYKHVNVET